MQEDKINILITLSIYYLKISESDLMGDRQKGLCYHACRAFSYLLIASIAIYNKLHIENDATC